MKGFKIVKYSSKYYSIWNDFVANSKNATFLFHRDFMEYHEDRFADFSLLIYYKEKLIALLPANIQGPLLYSHQGLSYGGFLLPKRLNFETTLGALKSILDFLFENKIEKLIIKQVPKIYCEKLSDELDYLMFILKAKLFRRDLSMAISLSDNQKYSKLRNREIKKAAKLELKFTENDDFSLFWNSILTPNLKKKHKVSPTHSISEITMLKQRFPNNIKQFSVFDANEMLAGCVVFETNNVAHLQYISKKKEVKTGALSFLIHQLATTVYKDKKYLDFGISNENDGKNINLGLLNWKQSFGASSVVHDFYEIEVANSKLLNTVFI